MSKAEYRYYELSRDLPLLVLTGEKWETVYGMDNMHFHNYLEVGYCHYGNGIIQFAEKETPYHAGTLTFIPKNIPHRTCPVPEEHNRKQKWEYLFIDFSAFLYTFQAHPQKLFLRMLLKSIQKCRKIFPEKFWCWIAAKTLWLWNCCR